MVNQFVLTGCVMMMPNKMELEFGLKVVSYEKENVMPYISSIERIGREEGRQEGLITGRQEGRQEGQAALMVRLFKRRWGALTPELETRLCTLSLAQLESLAETMLDFRDPSALQQWLDNLENHTN